MFWFIVGIFLVYAALQCKSVMEQATKDPNGSESLVTDYYNLVPTAPEGRFDGIERTYSPEDVLRLRGSIQVRYRQALAELVRDHDVGKFISTMTRVDTRSK